MEIIQDCVIKDSMDSWETTDLASPGFQALDFAT